MVSSIDSIPRTHISYLGWQETLENKEKLDEFNSRFDLKVEDSSLQANTQKEKEIEQTQIVEQKEEVQRVDVYGKEQVHIEETQKEPATDIEKTTQLLHAMHHNVLQNIPTQDIMRLRSSN